MSCLGMTALALARQIQKRKIGVREAVADCLSQIQKVDGALHAYLSVDEEGALVRADAVQRAIDAGDFHGPLAGVPFAVKDNLCTKGMPTTCASKMLANFVPPYDAQAVASLARAGAIVLGKTNMDEFAMGSTTETSAFGPTKNPHNQTHVPGGSSGGSCAAVAANTCFFALGSDTGGSIRQPSSFCGVVGLKPTYGTVSRYGLVAYGSSFDQVGPIAKDVGDCAAILSVMAAHDKKDSTSVLRRDTDFTAALVDDVKGMRIGIPRDDFGEGLDAQVRSRVLAVANVLKEKGATVELFDLGLVSYAIPAYYTIACAEASSNLSRFDGVKYGCRAQGQGDLREMYKKTRSEGFGQEVKRRILAGAFVLSAGHYDDYYLKALRVRARIRQAFDAAFRRFDVLLRPVAPATAPKLGESLGDPLKMYLGDIYTLSANLAGIPGMSVPCGRDAAGLPIGAQFLADSFQEKKMLRAAYSYECARQFERQVPHGSTI